jgi:hypothetical protein
MTWRDSAKWFVAAAIALLLLVSRNWTRAASGSPPALISKSSVVQLPVAFIEQGGNNREKLAISAGAEDELPDGPASFDITADGSFVIADRLKRRLVLYNDRGEFVRDIPLDFTPADVWVTASGAVCLESSAGHAFRANANGAVGATEELPPAPPLNSAILVGPHQGFLTGVTPSSQESAGVTVRFDGGRMVSIETIGYDSGRNIYAALETAVGSSEVDAGKILRKYRGDGSLAAEIRDVPVDYYVAPLREFRLKGQKIYQMVTGDAQVSINVWDTGSAR